MKSLLVVFLYGILFASASVADDIVTPIKKPETANEKMVNIEENISTYPPISSRTPADKLPRLITDNGIIKPLKKPLHITSIVSNIAGDNNKIETKPVAPQDRVTIRYRNDSGGDDRMAGRGVKRTYAERRTSQLKETTDKSPFKTKNLPRASKQQMSDPVILFFKEKSSDMEVGQIAVLKSDILNILKRNKNKKAILYGYAERDKKDKEKAHKLSLARALIVSDYLVDNRISDTRLEIRPMASDTPISPKDRVDVVIYN